MRYMRVFEGGVDIHGILAVGREVFPLFGKHHGWFCGYLEYLKEKLGTAVEANEDFNDLISGFGQEFDHFVVRHVLSLYASRIAKLGKDVEDRVIKLNDCQVVFEKTVPLPLVQEPARAAPTPAISEASSSDTQSLGSETEFVKIRKDE